MGKSTSQIGLQNGPLLSQAKTCLIFLNVQLHVYGSKNINVLLDKNKRREYLKSYALHLHCTIKSGFGNRILK